ncbi:DUF1642 domain-containing protein [Streptococcus suis]|uniref:DUF1642 domain-containing protein n=1 Tax=Streptococcus suis TaxID=1307 RepID=UPI0038BB885A
MNKQEAIEKLTEIANGTGWISHKSACNVVVQIHEPQQVVVPKFVAEYIERCKQSGWHLQKVLSRLDDDEKVGDWAYDENDDLISEKVDMVAHAWLFGYQIEQEQLYTVEIPNPNDNEITVLERTANGVVLAQFGRHEDNWKKERVYCLTESEIKQDFEWAWDAGFYEPVEVE